MRTKILEFRPTMVVFGIANLHQFGHLRITDYNRINADEQIIYKGHLCMGYVAFIARSGVN